MNKLYKRFIAALTISIFCAFSSTILYGQNFEQLTNFSSPNAGVFGNKISYSPDGKTIITHGDNGEINFYEYKDNALVHQKNVEIKHTKRTINVDGNDYVFYPSTVSGYVDINNNDSNNTNFVKTASNVDEIWVAENGSGQFFVYIKVNQIDGSYATVSSQNDIITVNQKLLDSSTILGYPYDTNHSFTPSAVEDDISLFGQHITFENDFTIYVGDPQYDAHTGRIVKYVIDNGVWTEKETESITPSNLNYFVNFGKFLEFSFFNNQTNKALQVFGDNYIYSTKDYTDTNIRYSSKESFISTTETTYPYFFNQNLNSTSSLNVINSEGKQNLYLITFEAGDDIFENKLITAENYDKIFDVEIYEDFDEFYIYVTGLKNGVEVVETYLSLDHQTFSLVTGGTLQLNTLGNTGNNQLQIAKIGNEKYSIFSRADQSVSFFSLGDNYEFTLDGKTEINHTGDWTTLGSGVYSQGLTYLFSNPTTKTIEQFRAPYTTIKNGEWDTPSVWKNGMPPLFEDENAEVLISHLVELGYNVNLDLLTIDANGQLNLVEPIEGSGGITSNLIDNLGLIFLYDNTTIISKSILNKQNLTITGTNTTLICPSIINTGYLNINSSSTYLEIGGNNKGFINSFDDIIISHTFNSEGNINFPDETKGFKIYPDENLNFSVSGPISSFVEVEDVNESSAIVYFIGNLQINNELKVYGNVLDASNASLIMGNGAPDAKSYINLGNISQLSFDNLLTKSNTTITDLDYNEAVINITNELTLYEKLTLEAINLKLAYQGSEDIIRGSQPISIVAGYDSHIQVDLKTEVAAPFSINYPIEGQIMEDGPGPFVDASFKLNVHEINYSSGGETGIVLYLNNYDAYSEPIKDIEGSDYGRIPGKSWFVEGTENVKDFGASISTKITDKAGFNFSNGNELKIHSKAIIGGVDFLVDASGTLDNVTFNALEPVLAEAYDLEVITSNYGKVFTSTEDGYLGQNIWDITGHPSNLKDIIFVKHDVSHDDFSNNIFNEMTIETAANFITSSNLESYPASPPVFELNSLTTNSTSTFVTDYVNLIINNHLHLDNNLSGDYTQSLAVGQPEPVLTFKGDHITTNDKVNASIDYSSFNIAKGDIPRNVIISPSVKVTNGSFKVEHPSDTVTFTNTFSLSNGSTIQQGGNLIFDNTSDGLRRDYTLAFGGEFPYDLTSLKIKETGNFTFASSATIKDSLFAKNTTGIYLGEFVTLEVLGEQLDGAVKADARPFELEVGEFLGISPMMFPSQLNIKNNPTQKRPYLIGADIGLISSIGDTLYVINGNDLGNNSGAIKHIVKDHNASAKLVVDIDNYITERNIINDDTEYVEISLSVTDPITGNLRNLDKEEIPVVKYLGAEITNFEIEERTITDPQTEASLHFTLVKIPTTEFSDVISGTPGRFTIETYIKHEVYTSLITPTVTTVYDYLPTGFIVSEDLTPLTNFLSSLEFRTGDFTSNFGVTWSPEDLSSWSGDMADFEGMENIIDLNEYGELEAIHIEDKNIDAWDLMTLNGNLEFLDRGEGEGEGEFPIGPLELEQGGELLPGEYQDVTINADNNYLYFDQFYDFIPGISPLINYNPATPFDVIEKSYVITSLVTYNLNDNGYYASNYAWLKKQEDGTFKDISNYNSTLAIDSLIHAGDYTIKLTEAESDFRFTVDIEFNLDITPGDADKEILKLILDNAGVVYDDTKPMREWKDDILFNDFGYVVSLNLDDLELTSIPSEVQDLIYLEDLSLANNNIEDIPSFMYEISLSKLNIDNNKLYFDDFDDLSSLEGTSITNTTQKFDTEKKTINVKHGKSITLSPNTSYEVLSYRWEKDDNDLMSNSNTFTIADMRLHHDGIYKLYHSSSVYPGFEFLVYEGTVNHLLGDNDITKLQAILDNNNIEYVVADGFRNWLSNDTDIDSSGHVVHLDLSSLGLTETPSGLSDLTNLISIDLKDNILFYDDLESLGTLLNIVDFIPQNYNETVEIVEVTQYSNYTYDQINIEYNGQLDYNWYYNGEFYARDFELSVENFNLNKEGKYTLMVNETDPKWAGLEYQVATINLIYKSLISEQDSIALHQLFTEMNVDFDDTQRIIEWPNFSFDPETGSIIGLDLNDLEGVSTLSSLINHFDELESLKLYGSNISSLPSELWSLPNLNYLDLSNNDLDDEDITNLGNLINLRTLWLSENNFNTLPDLGNLSQLLYLIANDNDISNLDFGLSSLVNLNFISFAGNQLEDLNIDFSSFNNLTKIDFSRNKISEWTSALPSSLEELILYSNLLETIEGIPTNVQLDIADNYLFFDDFEGYDKSTITKYIPQNYPIYYENVALIEGGAYSVRIPIEIKPEYVFTWYKDGIIQGTFKNNSITLENMSAFDVGIYSCFISHTYWSDLNIKIAEIGVGFDCSDNLTVDVEPTTATDFCFNEEVLATIKTTVNEEDVTYAWYNGEIPMQLQNSASLTIHEVGAYSVRVRNANGCIALSDTIHVTKSDVISTPEIIANGDSLFVSNVYDSYTYAWYLDGELISSGFSSIFYSTFGNYSVEAISENGCSTLSFDYTVGEDDVTSVENDLVQLNLYPQPANEYIFIDNLSQPIEELRAYDISGQLHSLQYNLEQNKTRINTSDLSNGLYIINIKTTDGQLYHQKIMISN
ncbi:T9SS type A sorting domain-containing protein [Flammeovirga pacifica]|uniref:Ig-like domain-containing protein n=1 Tax=Flammeovirga pacifica TaxID=915059 RepID=A0A1S1YVM1_FLAPC|nr:T9SS type A sorting domain-containing protein [Flammeovirga pacifica]OHX65071.1 hypothetical protein NH26_01245 [Flammeovirga pacifica]